MSAGPYDLELWNPDTGRYEFQRRAYTANERAALTAEGRESGRSWRVVLCSKHRPQKPPRAPGLSGARNPRVGTWAPSKGKGWAFTKGAA